MHALNDFYLEQYTLIDLFNIDLPNSLDLHLLIDNLSQFLKKVEVWKYSVALGKIKRLARTSSINLPMWDHDLIFDQLYVFLFPAFKWLRLFNPMQLEKLIRAQLVTLYSDHYLLDYSSEEAQTVKKTVEA